MGEFLTKHNIGWHKLKIYNIYFRKCQYIKFLEQKKCCTNETSFNVLFLPSTLKKYKLR